MRNFAGLSGGIRTRLIASALRPVSWAAVAAICGSILGAAALMSCVILPQGTLTLACSFDGFFGSLRISRVLTTLSLVGVCLMLTELRSRLLPWVMGTLAVLLSLDALVWSVAGGLLALSPPDLAAGTPGSELYVARAIFWGRPILMVLLGVALLKARRWFPAMPLLALGALEAPPVYAFFSSTVSPSRGEWVVSLLGFYAFGPGLIGAAGWVLLGVAIFTLGSKLDRRGLEEKRRAEEEKNRRNARRLYEEAWGAGDPSIVDELVAEDFLDYEHDRYGREEFKRSIADLRRTFPDLTLSIEEQTADGNTVTTGCVLSGTDSGGVLWYPPTGKHATFNAIYTDRFSDRGLVEHRGGIDTANLLSQLGLPSIDENSGV